MSENEVDPYDTVQIGDPAVRTEGPDCGVFHPDMGFCTRQPGHPGRHVAEGRSVVRAIWYGGESE